jgi:DHA1 family bicyclomycin/chloramphenicol resistance-like MFS transporter
MPAMPEIERELGLSSGAIHITLTTYTSAYAIVKLFYGPLADSFGRKPILLAGILFFIIASMFSALATNIVELTWIRAAQGFAGAAPAVIVSAIVRDMFEKEDFSRTMSYITLAMIVAPLAAPLIGGYLTVWFGWRSIFWLLSLVAILCMIASVVKIPETLSQKNKQRFSLKAILRNYAALLREPRAMGLIFTGGMSFAGMFTFLTGGAFIYIELFGIRVDHVGYLYGLNIIFMITMTTLNTRLVRRMGTTWMLHLGMSIQFSAGLLLVLGLVFNAGLWGVVIPTMMFIGTLPVIGSNSTAMLLSDYPHIAGTAVALSGTFRFGLGALAAGVLSLFAMTTAWPMVLIMAVCSTLSSAFYYLLVIRNKKSSI